MGLSRLVAGVTGITMLTVGLAVATAPLASADERPTNGGAGVLTPAQPYQDKDPKQTQDWLGQYLVKGKAVYCVKWEFNAPGPDTEYTPDGLLADKWGNTLDPQARAEVSYLLLRYGDTSDDNQAAAVAHLLHTYTATGSTDPGKGFKDVGYDAAAHLQELPSAAQDDVARIQADVKANFGPWKVTVTAPTGAQVIGTADKWTIAVNRDGGDGKAITGVPVKLKVTDGTVKKKTVTTPSDGSPLTVDVTPTGPNPTVEADVTAPTAEPLVQQPTDASANLQWTVTTGGQTPISDTGKTTATTAPGSVKVTKVDSKTNAGIAGVQLRLTGSDKTAAAVKQDGSPLNGADGKPLVVTTGADGTATVDGLRTPQDICLVEVAAPSGYDENFDASSPPTVCGSVEPGKTLTLQLANTPNTPTVPVTIPAGGSPPVLTAGTAIELNPGALAAVGGLVLAALAGVGLMLRRRRHASRG